MMAMDQRIQQFFEAYEACVNNALGDSPVIDTEAIANSFTDCFLGANPDGVACWKNDQQFREVIPKGYEFYRSIGTKAMRINSLVTTQLDEFHVIAKVNWKSFYTKPDQTELTISFDVIYILQTIGNQPRIFCFITGDEQKAYKDHGLIPG